MGEEGACACCRALMLVDAPCKPMRAHASRTRCTPPGVLTTLTSQSIMLRITICVVGRWTGRSRSRSLSRSYSDRINEAEHQITAVESACAQPHLISRTPACIDPLLSPYASSGSCAAGTKLTFMIDSTQYDGCQPPGPPESVRASMQMEPPIVTCPLYCTQRGYCL